MRYKRLIIGGLAGTGLLLSTAIAAAATEIPSNHSAAHATFERLEQPLEVKLAVAAGGLSLIGLELWWFLFSKPKAKQSP